LPTVLRYKLEATTARNAFRDDEDSSSWLLSSFPSFLRGMFLSILLRVRDSCLEILADGRHLSFSFSVFYSYLPPSDAVLLPPLLCIIGDPPYGLPIDV